MSAELGEQRLLRGGYGGGAVGQQEPENIPCPRCESTNTKFCYYNNYNLSQPRYFCKSCRRYWTRGGTLRNIPVGGGSRKSSKRRSSRPSSSSSSCATSQPPPPLPNANGVSSDDHADAVKTTSLQGPPVVDTPPLLHSDVNLNEALPVGSFSSLLGSVQQSNPFLGLGGYGLGLGFDGLAFGSTTDGPVVGGSSDQEPPSECNTWQVGEAEGGMTDNGDCFGWPDLAISTPGPTRFEYSFWPAN